VVSSRQTGKQTNRHTHHNTSHPPQGEVLTNRKRLVVQCHNQSEGLLKVRRLYLTNLFNDIRLWHINEKRKYSRQHT